jgi:hypothetical protein
MERRRERRFEDHLIRSWSFLMKPRGWRDNGSVIVNEHDELPPLRPEDRARGSSVRARYQSVHTNKVNSEPPAPKPQQLDRPVIRLGSNARLAGDRPVIRPGGTTPPRRRLSIPLALQRRAGCHGPPGMSACVRQIVSPVRRFRSPETFARPCSGFRKPHPGRGRPADVFGRSRSLHGGVYARRATPMHRGSPARVGPNSTALLAALLLNTTQTCQNDTFCQMFIALFQ